MQYRIIAFLFVFILSVPGLAAEYIIKYTGNSNRAFMMSPRMKMLDQHSVGQLIKVDIDDQAKAGVLAQLLSTPGVEYVVPNFELKAFQAPLDPQALKEQWAIKKVNAEKAWNISKNRGSRKIVIAVIDTGVDYRHESLSPNMVTGYDFRNNDSDPMDETSGQNPGHGTHCAGIIGATGLIDGGIVGISPEVSIMPLRFLGADGSGDLMAGIKAIDYAIEKGAKVISASWGAAVSRSQAQPLVDAVKRASDAGVIFVAAAANDGKNNDRTEMYPANAIFANTITVAASGPNDEKPSWSNYGKAKVHLASPGLNIMSTLPKDKYGNLSGTSMATPMVSGLVGLLLSQDESLSGLEVRSLLQATGAQVSIETACNCRIDAGAAMESVLQKKMFVAPNALTMKVNETQEFKGVYGEAPFKFESSDTSVATISETGVLTAVKDGETRVTITDAKGNKATSLAIHVGASNDDGGGGGGECPIGAPELCDQLCQILPLPWCQQ